MLVYVGVETLTWRGTNCCSWCLCYTCMCYTVFHLSWFSKLILSSLSPPPLLFFFFYPSYISLDKLTARRRISIDILIFYIGALLTVMLQHLYPDQKDRKTTFTIRGHYFGQDEKFLGIKLGVECWNVIKILHYNFALHVFQRILPSSNLYFHLKPWIYFHQEKQYRLH